MITFKGPNLFSKFISSSRFCNLPITYVTDVRFRISSVRSLKSRIAGFGLALSIIKDHNGSFE